MISAVLDHDVADVTGTRTRSKLLQGVDIACAGTQQACGKAVSTGNLPGQGQASVNG